MAKVKKSGDNVKKGGGAVIVIVVLVVVLVIAMAGVIAYLLLSRGKPEEAPAQADEGQRSVLVTSENVEEIINQPVPEESATDRYTVTMNTYWNFPDGKSPSSNAYVANSTDNPTSMYFDIQIVGEEGFIYQSPVIPRGGKIDSITLDKELEKGIYDCVMTYHLVDDNQKTLSTVNVALTINIGNVSGLD